MRLIDADALMTRLTPEDFGTPDERWLPERDIARLIQMEPTIDLNAKIDKAYREGYEMGKFDAEQTAEQKWLEREGEF